MDGVKSTGRRNHQINWREKMKKIGIIVLIIGLVGLALALGMDTSVATGHNYDRVHNIGLMSDKQNYLFVSIALAVVGVVLLALGIKNGTSQGFLIQTSANQLDRACPYCAEQIKSQAVVCRYCGKDVEALPNATSGSGITSRSQLIAKFGKRKLMYSAGALVLGALAAAVVIKLLEPPEPLFLSIENIATNLADPGGEKFAQVTVTLHVKDATTARSLKILLPSIRADILMRLSKNTSEQFLAPNAQEQLSAEIQRYIKEVMGVPVEEVLFQKYEVI
jgi:flagellar basal body-associated protein FliL